MYPARNIFCTDTYIAYVIFTQQSGRYIWVFSDRRTLPVSRFFRQSLTGKGIEILQDHFTVCPQEQTQKNLEANISILTNLKLGITFTIRKSLILVPLTHDTVIFWHISSNSTIVYIMNNFNFFKECATYQSELYYQKIYNSKFTRQQPLTILILFKE